MAKGRTQGNLGEPANALGSFAYNLLNPSIAGIISLAISLALAVLYISYSVFYMVSTSFRGIPRRLRAILTGRWVHEAT